MTAIARLLRVVAVLIAVMGVVDPVMTWPRADPPVIAVIDAGATALTSQVMRELSRDYAVHAGAIAGAAGTVLVGRALPVEPFATSGALVSVTPMPASPRVEIEQLSAPSTTTPVSRIPVTVSLRAVGASGRALRIDLYAGAVLVDRVVRAVTTSDERLVVALSAAPSAPGVSRLTVRVRDNAGGNPELNAVGVVATEAWVQRWNVLIVDPRPSWTSTFVRRALEADRRFSVNSRVATSRAVAVESGDVPSLADVAALQLFSVVIVGAPDALSANDVRALEVFARGRGGAVVFLMDRVDAGPFARLTGASSWRDVHGVERRTLANAAGTMIATELAVPEGLSAGVDVLAAAGKDARSRPAVWQTPLGAGRVVVSGALDAWRYRTREQNGFARFWTQIISDVAAAAPPPLTVLPTSRVVAPGASVDIRVIVRSAQLSEAARPAPIVEARATFGLVAAPSGGDPLRLWPTSERGVFAVTLRVPEVPGTYRAAADAVNAGGAPLGAGFADIDVGDGLIVPATDDLPAWTTAHGGVVVPQARVAELESIVRARVPVVAQPARAHPMRSVWWLPVFISALGGEWWLRRRRGER